MTPTDPFAAAATAVRVCLDGLDRLEWDFDAADAAEKLAARLERCDDHVGKVQSLLSDLAETVRRSHEGLAELDAEVEQAISMFATARTHLQSV